MKLLTDGQKQIQFWKSEGFSIKIKYFIRLKFVLILVGFFPLQYRNNVSGPVAISISATITSA